jgi:hypothetical protein
MGWMREEERGVEGCLGRRSERDHNMSGVRRAIVWSLDSYRNGEDPRYRPTLPQHPHIPNQAVEPKASPAGSDHHNVVPFYDSMRDQRKGRCWTGLGRRGDGERGEEEWKGGRACGFVMGTKGDRNISGDSLIRERLMPVSRPHQLSAVIAQYPITSNESSSPSSCSCVNGNFALMLSMTLGSS